IEVSVFIPYLIKNKENGYVQNSTVVDLQPGVSIQLSVLAPPRTDTAVILVGEFGREYWPIRNVDESWRTWHQRGGFTSDENKGVQRMPGQNSTLNTINASMNNGGDVVAIKLGIERPIAVAYSDADGGRHSTGLVDGRTVFNYISVM
ncbi:MAG TPA: hypothetical protein D7H86_00455, partial [Candidatus Poseidoniales archaeon]